MTLDGDLYLMPESRCARYGHVDAEVDMFGMLCLRCGRPAPTEADPDGEAWRARIGAMAAQKAAAEREAAERADGDAS